MSAGGVGCAVVTCVHVSIVLHPHAHASVELAVSDSGRIYNRRQGRTVLSESRRGHAVSIKVYGRGRAVSSYIVRHAENEVSEH